MPGSFNPSYLTSGLKRPLYGGAESVFRGLGTAKAFHKFVPLVFLNIPEILGTAADFV